MNRFPDYCVAIRTLGRAGEKFVKMITSLKGQTHPPKAIFVYLAEGYSQPEQIADEIYVTCPKGMMRQRAQRYEEIDTDYILFCDDDVLFQPDSVLAFYSSWLWTALMSALVCALRRRTLPFKASLKGLRDAKRFVASDEFRRLPLWKSLWKS